MLKSVVLLASLLTATQGRLLKREFPHPHFVQPAAEDFCASPIPKAPMVFPESIIGRANTDFEMMSGYVNVTSEDWLYYLYYGTADKNPEAPLIIWTNGGPGCSSMEGATTENGPLILLDVKESCQSDGNCDYTGSLSTNKYSWNAHANLVYVDQPRYVGNSGGYGDKIHSSVDAALDFVTFYKGFIRLYPEFEGRDLIVAGESYGGHYVPAFAQAILDANANGSNIPLKGVVIGNGCIDDEVESTETYVDFLHASNLIPSDVNPKTQAAAEVEVIATLGYQPNYYDFRLNSVSCPACFGYNYTAWSYWFLRDDVKKAMNVCGNAGNNAFAGAAGGCISVSPFDANDKFDYSAALANTLDAGIPVVMYYGKCDTACNYVGGYAVAQGLDWSGKEAFNTAELEALEFAGCEAGQTKSANGLTWMQFESSGHMVGLDQGVASAAAIDVLLKKYR
jgi:carboxypeptidase C (cathepsin A)